MKEVLVWKSSDGKLFEDEYECRKHEDMIAADILNKYVLGFDEDGNQVSWSGDKYIVFALLLRHPTSDELEELALDCAWANYLDPDLSDLPSFRSGEQGWYVRDTASDYWYTWQEYSDRYCKMATTIGELFDKEYM